jgi:hypothetical protein
MSLIATITAFLAGPYAWVARWAAIGLLALSLFAAGWVKRGEHDERIHLEEVGKAAVETVRIARARDRVTTVIETKYLPAITKQQVVTETIVKEVPVYVPASSADLPGGFRVLYDAAALGLVPDPAAVADAAPVPAQDLARTDTENLGVCRADQLRLRGLQEWIEQQRKVVKP